jgi:DNA ligase-1
MLAGKAPDFDKIIYPVIASPKLDGIRCVILNGKALTRSLKPIPNHYTCQYLESMNSLIDNFDGELIIPGAKFNEISSAIMSYDGVPQFEYHVFDLISPLSYVRRLAELQYRFNNIPSFCRFVNFSFISNSLALEDYEKEQLKKGYEGIMIRSINGPYKFGRSTTKEGYLLKIKRFDDGEAEIVWAEELEHNENPAFTGELGQTKRSSCQYGKTAGGMLGALVVKDIETGVEFKLGTGFDADERIKLWSIADKILGKIVKYKYQSHGSLNKPRSPVFLGFRAEEDMS